VDIWELTLEAAKKNQDRFTTSEQKEAIARGEYNGEEWELVYAIEPFMLGAEFMYAHVAELNKKVNLMIMDGIGPVGKTLTIDDLKKGRDLLLDQQPTPFKEIYPLAWGKDAELKKICEARIKSGIGMWAEELTLK